MALIKSHQIFESGIQIDSANIKDGVLFNALDANAKKITGLASGTATGDALHYGQIGAQIQGYSPNLSALGGLSSASDKIPYFTDSETAGLLNLSTSTSLGTSDTTISSQKAIKTYIDNSISEIVPALSWVNDVLDVQVDNTLDPSETPSTGDRYIITDAANLHANFGTISGVANNDIVEYDGSDFVVSTDVSTVGEGVLTWVGDVNKIYQYNGTAWVDRDSLFTYTAGDNITVSSNVISLDATGFAKSLLDDEDAATARTTLSAAKSGANTDITSVLLNQSGLVVKGGDSNGLTIKLNETLTSARTLNFIVNDADATLDLTGTLTVEDTTTISAYADTFLNVADEAAFKAAVNLEIGTDVQAYNANSAIKYSGDFNDSTDWAGSGPYTFTVAAATHGRGATKSLIVQVKEDGAPNSVVNVDITVADNGDVVVTSDSSKFAGDIVIIG